MHMSTAYSCLVTIRAVDTVMYPSTCLGSHLLKFKPQPTLQSHLTDLFRLDASWENIQSVTDCPHLLSCTLTLTPIGLMTRCTWPRHYVHIGPVIMCTWPLDDVHMASSSCAHGLLITHTWRRHHAHMALSSCTHGLVIMCTWPLDGVHRPNACMVSSTWSSFPRSPPPGRGSPPASCWTSRTRAWGRAWWRWSARSRQTMTRECRSGLGDPHVAGTQCSILGTVCLVSHVCHLRPIDTNHESPTGPHL